METPTERRDVAPEQFGEAKEHLEPEQEHFLSRMAELETLSPATSNLDVTPVNSVRLNFGMIAFAGVSTTIPIKTGKQKFSGGDKGYSGVLAPKDKHAHRIKKPNKKAHREENNENISDNSPLAFRRSEKEKSAFRVKPADSNDQSVPASSTTTLNSKSGLKFSIPSQLTDVPPPPTLTSLRFQSSVSLTSTSSTLSGALSSSTASSLSSLSVAATITPSVNQTTKIPELNSMKAQKCDLTIPKIGGLAVAKSSDPPTMPTLSGSSNRTQFSIPSIGSLGAGGIASSGQGAPTLGSLSSTSSTVGQSFSIPAIGSLGASPSSSGASLRSLASQNTAAKPGGLQGNQAGALTIPKLGSLGGNSSSETFTIPKLGSLGGSNNTSKSTSFTVPSLEGLKIASSADESVSSLNSLANLHLSSHSVPQQFSSEDNLASLSSQEDESSRSHVTVTSESTADDTQDDDLSLQEDIDLTSALKLASEVRTSPDKMKSEEMEVKTDLLITDLRKIKSKLLSKNPSSLGKVIALRWRWKTDRQKVVLPPLFCEADRFSFAEESPDDIVLRAQTQSKSFLSRARTASPSRH